MDGSDSRLALGRAGEDAALAGYVASGYRLVARNWRCRLGELDLVVERGRTLVFCEVKARRGSALGGPFDAVTRRKQDRLRRLAEAFLGSSALFPEEVRFDVASVTMGPGGRPSVHLFQGAF